LSGCPLKDYLFVVKLVLTVLFCYSCLGMAEIYKWVDAGGNVNYGDRPPNPGAQKIEVKAEVTDARRQDAERINQQYQRLYQEYKRQDSARLAQEQKNREQKQKRDSACKEAQKYVNVANQNYAFYKLAEDGSKAYLTDEEIAAYRAKVNADHKKHCSD
jgi:hypothetical protein